MKTLVGLLVCLALTGCVNVHWSHPQYGEITYTRRGGQDIKGVRLMIDSNIVFSLDQQHADGDEIGQVAEAVSRGVVGGISAWVKP